LKKNLPDLKRPALPPGVAPGGHGGSHGYLMNEFVNAILQDRKPQVDNLVTTDARERFDGIRADNQALTAKAGLISGAGVPPVIDLDRGNEYLDVAASQVPAVSAIGNMTIGDAGSVVAATLVSIPRQRRKNEDTQAASEQLAASLGAL
jgi:hypothetical protein